MVNALSAPVLDASGHAVLALTAVGDATRFDAGVDGDFADALRETAKIYHVAWVIAPMGLHEQLERWPNYPVNNRTPVARPSELGRVQPLACAIVHQPE